MWCQPTAEIKRRLLSPTTYGRGIHIRLLVLSRQCYYRRHTSPMPNPQLHSRPHICISYTTLSLSPPIDDIWAAMIVCAIRREIIRTVLC